MSSLSLMIVQVVSWAAVVQFPSGAGLVLPRAGQQSDSEVRVELLASHDAIWAGGAIELALRFHIEKDWHLYWQNPGESGMEPTLHWELPPGFTVGPMRYPPPRRYVDATGATSFILEGEPVLLVSLNAPPQIVETAVSMGVEVEWLTCKEMCKKGRSSLSVRLPVVVRAGDAKPANVDLFTQARKALPTSADKAPYLDRLYAVAEVDRVRPGDAFKIAVILEIPSGQHVNAHEPGSDFLIPTDVFSMRVPGVTTGSPTFPPGQAEQMDGQRSSVYRGQVKVLIPVEAKADLAGEWLRLAGVVQYQSCSDTDGVCYPPVAAAWELSLPIAKAGEAVQSVHPEIFRKPALRITLQREEHSLLVWLLLAFVAGLLLNVMPCVLPVISIKVLSFVQQSHASHGRMFKHGLAFSFGMLLVFNVLALLATAAGMVWGQHFQSPVFTIAMASVLFVFALSLMDVFTLGVPRAIGEAASHTEGEGYGGSVLKGAFATLMGTPCLGPMLGTVLVWALAQSPGIKFLVFNTIGLGMALPYLLLTAHPAWLRFLPKPGRWMVTFEEAMSFLLMGTVIWLLHIVRGQLGGEALIDTLAFLLSLGVASWIVGRWLNPNTPLGNRATIWIIASAIPLCTGLVFFSSEYAPECPPGVAATQPAQGELFVWEPFSADHLKELTSKGQTVMVDVTADWCPNCKYNSSFVFNTPEVAAALNEYKVTPMLADWTRKNKEIEQFIQKLAPGGSIPLCVVFPGKRPDEPIVMLGIVTQEQVIQTLREASK